MRYVKTIAVFFCFFLLVQKISAQVEKLDNGVLIHLSGSNTKSLELEVVSDKIIHVIISPVDPLKKDTSLMIIGDNKKTEWSVVTKNN
jgi:hypothetical protein